MTSKAELPYVRSLGNGAVGGLVKGVARNLLHPQQHLSTRFVSLRSRGIQNLSRILAIIRVRPPCNVILWACSTSFSAIRDESGMKMGYSPGIRSLHTIISFTEFGTKFN